MICLMFLSFSLVLRGMVVQIFLSITGGSKEIALLRGSAWRIVFLYVWDNVFLLKIVVSSDPISPVATQVLGSESLKSCSTSLSFSIMLFLSLLLFIFRSFYQERTAARKKRPKMAGLRWIRSLYTFRTR